MKSNKKIGLLNKLLFICIIFLLITGCTKSTFFSGIDYSCETDSDCEIKNVGNQCGYFPECVNKNFVPNPPELDSIICGFPSIESCECVESKCIGK
jgi:hypothetical protein